MADKTGIIHTERIIVLLGPTGGGKSDLAVTLALHLNAEIVNADSMQVYRRLDAATAKPAADQLAAVPHHLVNVVDPSESWTVADWLEAAEAAITDIRSRNRLPLVVGGTNLYLRALLEGMFEGPGADEAFRASLADVSPRELHLRLQKIDPEAASRISTNDHKRLVRALEVHHLTGQPISAQQQQWSDQPAAPYRHNPILIGLQFSPPVINRRINARVKLMFDPPDGSPGLIEETRALLAAQAIGPQAAKALGTRQVLQHLEGRYSEEEAFERVKIETRRFAKAQRTWMKRFRNVQWLDADEATTDQLADVAEPYIRSQLNAPPAPQGDPDSAASS